MAGAKRRQRSATYFHRTVQVHSKQRDPHQSNHRTHLRDNARQRMRMVKKGS